MSKIQPPFAVFIENEQDSLKVQKAFFSLGYEWLWSGKTTVFISSLPAYFAVDQAKMIFTIDSIDDYKEISIRELFSLGSSEGKKRGPLETGTITNILIKGWKRVGCVKVATAKKLGDDYLYEYQIWLNSVYIGDYSSPEREMFYAVTHNIQSWLTERGMMDEIEVTKVLCE